MSNPFTESQRYEYPLTGSSLVIDAGAHLGEFANAIARRYNCRVNAYEPVFYKDWAERHHYVNISKMALGGSRRMEKFKVKGSMTGRFADDGEEIDVPVEDIVAVLYAPVDLLKLNVEGMEFEILERLLSEPDRLAQIKNIQVQFHGVVDNAEARWKSIRERLLATHQLTFDAPWCWENYERMD